VERVTVGRHGSEGSEGTYTCEVGNSKGQKAVSSYNKGWYSELWCGLNVNGVPTPAAVIASMGGNGKAVRLLVCSLSGYFS
jgi:hypothetical protein